MDDVGRFLYVLLLIVFVALLAYYSTRLLGRARGGIVRSGKKNLEVLESVGVGAQSMVQIVRAGSRYLLIGVTKERVTLLIQLEESELRLSEASTFAGNAFGETLRRFISKEKPVPSETEPREKDDEEKI